MADAAWEALVEEALLAVAPDLEARRLLTQRMHDDGDLAVTYAAWCNGGDHRSLKRLLVRLAREKTPATGER